MLLIACKMTPLKLVGPCDPSVQTSHTFAGGMYEGLGAIRATNDIHKASVDGTITLLRAICTGPAHAEPTEVLVKTMSMMASAAASYITQKTRDTSADEKAAATAVLIAAVAALYGEDDYYFLGFLTQFKVMAESLDKYP